MIAILKTTATLALGALITFGAVHLFGDPSSRCACEVAIPQEGEFMSGADGISVCVPLKITNAGNAPRVTKRRK